MLNFSNIFRSVVCLRHTVLAFVRLYVYNHTIPYIPPRSYSSHLVIVLVRVVTVNAAVLGELGRFPLSMFAREWCLKYWYTIIFNRYTTVLAMQYFQNSVTVCYINSFHNDSMFKLNFEFESYLSCITNTILRTTLTRLGHHHIR